MLKKKLKLLLLFISFSAIYIISPNYSFGQCNQKLVFKMGKFAKSEGNEYLRDFVIYPKSIVNETKKTYKLKLNEGTKYKFYMSAKQSKFNAKLTLYDSELNLIDTITNWQKQKYYSLEYLCKKSDIYIFEISGMKSEITSEKNCIPVILTFIGKEE
jgi:hypothetical protein